LHGSIFFAKLEKQNLMLLSKYAKKLPFCDKTLKFAKKSMKVFNIRSLSKVLTFGFENTLLQDKAILKELQSFQNQHSDIMNDEEVGVLLEEICKKLNDIRVGLKFGFHTPLSALGVVGQVYQNCCNFSEVLEKMKLHISYLDNVNSYQVEITESSIIQKTIGNKEWRDKFPIAERQFVEHNIGFSLRCKREYLGRNIEPLEIWSPYKKIGKTDLLENYFTCPVKFEQECMAVVLPKTMLSWEIPTSNPEILLITETFLENKKNNGTLFADKVKQTVNQQFQYSMPNLKTVSKMLMLSQRTLQRRLKSEHTNFQNIVDKARLEMAELFLKNSTMSIQEISDRLAFDVVNSFIRFFKKYHKNTTPLQYRNINCF
jgi:AraC-like DNA-binding protein